MKTKFVIVLFLTVSILEANTLTFEKENLYKYWILSESESGDNIKVYRPEDYSFIKEPSMNVLFSGIEFLENGEVRQYRWKKCGNDASLNYYKGTWELVKEKNSSKLIVKFSNTYQNSIQIIELSNDKLEIIYE